jgi:hypothetical protein
VFSHGRGQPSTRWRGPHGPFDLLDSKRKGVTQAGFGAGCGDSRPRAPEIGESQGRQRRSDVCLAMRSKSESGLESVEEARPGVGVDDDHERPGPVVRADRQASSPDPAIAGGSSSGDRGAGGVLSARQRPSTAPPPVAVENGRVEPLFRGHDPDLVAQVEGIGSCPRNALLNTA